MHVLITNNDAFGKKNKALDATPLPCLIFQGRLAGYFVDSGRKRSP